MVKSRIISVITLFLALLVSNANGQTDRYFVFFSDKEGSEYSLENPEEFLSERAIDRRERHSVSIELNDLPVNENYLQQVESLGAEVYFPSKWFNGAIVQMDQSLLDQVNGLSFVDSVHYIARGEKLSNETVPFTVPDVFQEPQSIDASTDLQLGMINADDMHADGYTGEGIMIGVMDGGFIGVNRYKAFENLQKEDRVLAEIDFVRNSDNPYQYSSHGTAVLSTIVGEYGQFRGSAYDSKVLLYVTEDIQSEFRIEEYNWVLAAEHADSAGADILHSSVGYNTFNDGTMNYTYEDLNGEVSIITRAASIAFSKGIFVVTSAGNEGNNEAWPYITAPADAVDILSVGSVTSAYEKSNFSSIGPTIDGRIKPDVVALGTRTAIVNSNGDISTGNGTSYSAPIVAGLVAGIWQANPSWTNFELLNAIRTTASRAFEPDEYFGYGIPNYTEAVIGRVLAVSDILTDRVKVFPNPFSDNRVYIDFSHDRDVLPLKIMVYDTKGALVLNKEVQVNSDNLVELDIKSEEKGIYFLKLVSGKFTKYFKLLKY